MKILIIGGRPDLLAVRDRIARLPISINSVCSEDTFLEILPQGSSKGAALEFVAQHLGIPLSEIIAVGDNLNDLEMIRTAGLGVAMGNAPPELRAQAGYVTSTNDEGGLAEVISGSSLTERRLLSLLGLLSLLSLHTGPRTAGRPGRPRRLRRRSRRRWILVDVVESRGGRVCVGFLR